MKWEMMVLSMLYYQADECMEAVIGERFKLDIHPIPGLIDGICGRVSDQLAEGTCNKQANDASGATGSSRKDIAETLTSFIHHPTAHSLVKHSNPSDHKALISELQLFLHAHLTQLEDNVRFACQQDQLSKTSTVNTSNASPTPPPKPILHLAPHHIRNPYFLALQLRLPLTCLLGGDLKYYSQALYHHLATVCRQYIDHGSVARDRAEGNLNGVNYPELYSSTEDPSDVVVVVVDGGVEEGKVKAEVLELAEFERGGVVLAKSRLELEWRRKKMGMVREAVGAVCGCYGFVWADLCGEGYCQTNEVREVD
ncbi:MAG: hypothetical protein Q9188_000388 [Gyalolechia gomerana]